MRRGLRSRVFRGILTISCVMVGIAAVQLPGGAAAAAPVSGVGGVFQPSVGRVLDTRSGLGAPAGAVGAGKVVSLQLPASQVPAAATAVRLDVTAVSPTAATYITVYPDGTARPVASNLNVPAGGVISNLVTVKLGANGKVDLYNNAGSVQLVADLVGYDTPDGTAGDGGAVFSALPPARALDTRDGTGGHSGRVPAGGVVSLQVRGENGVPSSGTTEVVLNVTVVDPAAAGYVTVYPDGTSRPGTSNLNYAAGQTVPNLVIAQPGSDGKVDLYASGGPVDLVADVAGYGTGTSTDGSGSGVGTDGALFDPLGPARVLDTRNGTGTGTAGPVGADSAVTVPVAGHNGVPADATAVVLNVTATGATAATYVTVYPSGTIRPDASNLNVPAGATISNQVIVPVGADGGVAFYNHAGSAHLIADLAGYYTTGATSPWHTTAAPLPTGTPAGSTVSLAGVACATGGGCVATGYASGDDSQAILLSGTGTSWTAVDAPLPADAVQPALAAFDSAPACPAVGTCLATGIYDTASGSTGHLLVRGYGTAWTTTALPLLPGATVVGEPRLACGPTGCAVATEYRDASGTTGVMVVTGDAATDVSAWTPRAVPAPAGATGGSVSGVSAVGCGPAACAVAATYKDAAGVPHPFLATGSGSTWTAADAPLPAGDSAPDGNLNAYTLTSVFCGPAACAVAGFHRADTDYRAVLLTGDGSTWTASNVPSPADTYPGYYPMFDSVVCPAAASCVGTGHYVSTTGNRLDTTDVLVSGWGSAWTENPLHGPDGAQRPDGSFTLACPTTACVVAGGYVDIWGVSQFAVGGGTLPTTASWPTQKATPPPNAHYTDSTGPALQVACASATACVAVGSYWDNTATSQGVLMTGSASG